MVESIKDWALRCWFLTQRHQRHVRFEDSSLGSQGPEVLSTWSLIHARSESEFQRSHQNWVLLPSLCESKCKLSPNLFSRVAKFMSTLSPNSSILEYKPNSEWPRSCLSPTYSVWCKCSLIKPGSKPSRVQVQPSKFLNMSVKVLIWCTSLIPMSQSWCLNRVNSSVCESKSLWSCQWHVPFRL